MNIIITGASRGMGLNHAKFLSNNKSYKIIITDISKEASSVFNIKEKNNLNQILKKKNVKICYGDLTKQLDIKKVIKEIKLTFKNKIDAVICNAGGDIPGNAINAYAAKPKINNYMIKTSEFNQIFNRNFITTFNFLKKIVPIMKKNKYGKIITISSINAILDLPNEFSYSVSKKSVIHFSKILARDLIKYNIQVNCLCPGPTLTSRFLFTLKDRKKNEKAIVNKKNGLNRIANQDDISKIINFLLSKDANILTGQTIIADYGYSIGK